LAADPRNKAAAGEEAKNSLSNLKGV